MSYQVLARKWRPRTFEQMAGQAHVLRALSNGLANGRLHHAYLFTGTRGVGKTTVARILAKCLNCEREGVTATPCGECDACVAIDAGRFVDLIEVDAASRTKVEDTRELLDNVQYAPTRGRFKIYLIDEVHMLSGHSFNALLKTLEEPPPHVKFLLATTDPQKLPVTVLSRCLQFSLKHLPSTLIADYLADILSREGIESEAAAVERIARAAGGSMRDALSLIDQALAYGAGVLRDDDVRAMLGTVGREFVLDLLDAVGSGDGAAALGIVAEMTERAPDFAQALDEILAALHHLALAQNVADALPEDLADRERLLALAERLGREETQLFYQIALAGRRDLPLAPEPRIGFEMTVLRMIAFRPADSAPVPTRTAGHTASSAPKSASGAASRASGAASTGDESGERRPRPEPTAAPAQPPETPASTPQPPKARDDTDAEPVWAELVEKLTLSGLARALAAHCDWVGREGSRIRLSIDEGHRHLVNPGASDRLQEALGQHFGGEVELRIDVGEVERETPAQSRARVDAERQASAERAIAEDPNVAALKDTFGASVEPDSIRPVNIDAPDAPASRHRQE